ncbi:probable calcium-binding protein CML49 [Carica papaya]|uniref:probable calcium-binding protein CML49 n=1 Tax=Carica papaya TaxID=3649 RepID=UPI000B8CA1C7|nr:probable calcium-binding protein CML49 [Carica papaya]
MPTTLTHLLFLTSIIVNFSATTLSDNPCAYPCYPPPTGTGSGSGSQQTPATLTPPYAQSGSYSPPGYYPTPASGNLPNNPTPSYGTNNNNPYGAPPPPDPILPYFPFYYRKPPHQTDQSSSAPDAAAFLGKSTVAISLVLAFYLSVFAVRLN